MTKATLDTRKKTMEAAASKVAGVPVELTIRGTHQFTFSAEGDAREAFEKLRAWLALGLTTWEVEHDAECGTFAYFTVSSLSI